MHCNDTITCAVTPGAGRVLPTTASVFKAVSKNEFDAGCNHGRTGCQNASRCYDCATCGTAFSHNRNADCGCNNGCERDNNCACETTCGTAFSRNRNTDCSCNNGCQCDNNCTCEATCGTAFSHNRNTDCGCNNGCERDNNCACETTCGTAFSYNRNTDCGCNNGCSGNSHRHGRHNNRTPAMVYEEEHELCQLHEAEEAIRKGTLFPQLYMPMNGECADACGAQLCEGQAEAFAAWEIRLYLNTHPCDQQALKLFRKLARKTCEPNYATTFAGDCDDRWSWTDAPWDVNCGCE